MRTWLAKAVSEGRQFAHFFIRTVAATIAVLSFRLRFPPWPNPPTKSAAKPA